MLYEWRLTVRTTCVRIVVAAVLVAVICPFARAEGFRVRLGLENGHLKEVFFGCEEGATSGYDRGLDDLAPPPGIQTGYTAFETPVVNMPKFFYKDIRGLDEDVTWRFYAEVFPKKPVTVTWDPADLPDAHEFVLSGGGSTYSMRDCSSVTVESSETLLIKMTSREAEPAPPPEPSRETAAAKSVGERIAGPESAPAVGSQEAEPTSSGSRKSVFVVLAVVLGIAVGIGFFITRQ